MTRLQHLQLAEAAVPPRWALVAAQPCPPRACPRQWQRPSVPPPARSTDTPGCSWAHLRPFQSTRTGLTWACSPLVRGCVCSTHNPHHKDTLSSPTGDCTDRPGNKQLQRTNKRSHGCIFLGSSKVEIPAEAFPAHGIFFASSSLFQILLPTAEPGCTLSLRGYQMGNFLRFSIFSSLELLMLSSLAEMFWKWGGLG